MPSSLEFEPSNPLIFSVSFKVDMLFLICRKFEENLSTGLVLMYLTYAFLNLPHV